MPVFSISIDDGEFAASEPCARHRNMDEAVEATLKAAAEIAADRSIRIDARQVYICEVQDVQTRERQVLQLAFDAREIAPETFRPFARGPVG